MGGRLCGCIRHPSIGIVSRPFRRGASSGIPSWRAELYEELQGNPSRATRAKLDFLENVLTRLDRKDMAADI